MKTKLILSALLIIAAIGANAQNLIAVQQGKGPTFYTDLPTAINNASVGDTVYIPGGTFPAITINKKLYLIGVGHNPDSAKVTSRTMIVGVTLGVGSDNGSITGIYTNGMIVNGNGHPISGTTISRCYVAQLTAAPDVPFVGSNSANNFILRENIIGTLNMFWTTNCTLSNNIFTGTISLQSGNSYIRNNLFLITTASALFTSTSIIENNIFPLQNFPIISGDNNFFNNNVNAGNNNGSDISVIGNNNKGSNNYVNIPLSTIFPTFDPASLSTDAIYKFDFNLPIGLLKNGGADGTDIGIYGGAFPWKPGSVPYNPHFQSINIAPQTDASGNLKVQITVAAQDH